MKHCSPFFLTPLLSLLAGISLQSAPENSLETTPAETPAPEAEPLSKSAPLQIEKTSLSFPSNDGLPRFSWLITPQGRGQNQTAYRIKVTTTDGQPVWDFPKVSSAQSTFVPYFGEPLDTIESSRDYQWQVQVWNDEDIVGPWSEKAPLALQSAAGIPEEPVSLSHFESSDARLNAVFQKALSTQKENLAPSPTFAPDNLPWGDSVHLTARGYAFLSDLTAHYLAWTKEIVAQQGPDGLFSAIPSLAGELAPAAGYSDSGVITPFTLWQLTGNPSFLDHAFEPAVAYLAERKKLDPDFSGKPFGVHLGDRGHRDDATSQEFLSLAYFGLDCRLVSEMAEAVGHPPFLLEHRASFSSIQNAFAENFLDEDGTLMEQSQTAHLLALRFGLLPAASKQKTIDALITSLQSEGLKAGNLGIGALLPVLTWTGHQDLALQFVRDFGKEESATATVELAVASDWMMTFLAGINHELPGFKVCRIAPYLPADHSITQVSAYHESPYGRISSEWERTASGTTYKVTIPPNTHAILSLPVSPDSQITESGNPLESVPGCHLLEDRDGRKEFSLPSGSYQFLVTE